MEEFNVKAIVLRASDSGENDRTVRLFCEDGEVRAALLHGVKKEKAKLKFAAQPFAFCEYSLVKRGLRYIVKTAMSLGDTFALTRDIEKYLYACVVCEAAEAAAPAREPALFIELLKSMQALLYKDIPPPAEAVRYLLACLKLCGLLSEKEHAGGEKGSVAEFFARLVRGDYPAAETALLNRAFRLAVNDFESRFDCRLKTPSMALAGG